MARTLTIQRESRFVACMAPFYILLDGKGIGKVRSGAQTQLTIDEEPHEMKIVVNSATVPGLVGIPAGTGDLVYSTVSKLGFPNARVEIRQISGGTGAEKARNGLDDYRPGGARYTPIPADDDRAAYDRCSLREIEEFLIANTAARILCLLLDRDSEPMRDLAASTGQRIGGVKARLTVQKGNVHIERTFFSDSAFRTVSKLGASTQDEPFDGLVCGFQPDKKCKATGHDIGRIHDLILTRIAEKQSGVWALGDTLYDHRP